MPSFWLGLILLLIFSVNLQWVSSVANLEASPVKRVILPAVTLSVFYMARLIRLVRSGLIEEMTQPYVLAAHAKGLRNHVVFAHTFRNTLLPVVAFLILDLSFLMGGSVVVESVFSYSGIGEQLVHAILNRDYALVQATVFVIAIIVVGINGLSNLLYRVIDPRVRATESIA
jgi:peptide/nickel transport system permease protein